MFQKHKLFAAAFVALSWLVLAVPGAVSAHSELVFQKHKVPPAAVLLARHAPVVVLHAAERSAPTNVEGFIADAELVGGRYDVREAMAFHPVMTLDEVLELALEPAPHVALS